MEFDISTLDAEIGNVKKQIEDAQTSFLNALNDGNQFLMQHWGKEKEQLRNLMELLHKEKLVLLQGKRILRFVASTRNVSERLGVGGSGNKRNKCARYDEVLQENLQSNWAIEAKRVGASVGNNLQEAGLGELGTLHKVQLPVLSDLTAERSDLIPSEIQFMGREEFPKVLKFVEEASVGRSVYTGLSGAGKSFIFGAVAAYLHRKFKTEAAPKRGRVIYIQGKFFAEDHMQTTLKALMVAFHDDPGAMSELKVLRKEKKVIEWLSLRKWKDRRLYVLVDDGNCFDIGDKSKSLASRQKLEAASDFLRKLTMDLVFVTCASICSDVYKLIDTDKPVPYLLARPAFSEKELDEYLKRFQKPADWSKDREFLQKTGRVPRLVSQYGTSEFEQTAEAMRGFISEHIKEEHRHGRLEEFIKIVAGATCRLPAPRALLSKCFYNEKRRGTLEGRGACVTEALRRYTEVRIAKKFDQSQQEEMESAMGRWTGTMGLETMKSRIGLNAEAATILALRCSRLKVGDLEIRFNPEKVFDFSGTFQGFGFPGRELSLPRNPSNKGLHCYYEDLAHVVCIQITTAFDPLNTQKGTYGAFLAATRNDSRKKVLLWVVYGVDTVVREHKRDNATEIFCCFNDLNGYLRPVDEACLRIDEEKLSNKVPKTISKAGAICQATTKAKRPCRRYCVKGNDYCVIHSPQ